MTDSKTKARIFSLLLSILAVFLISASSAQATPKTFEMGLGLGYTYGMALTPADASRTPSVTADGHGFAVTISPGAKIADFVGLYADIGLNLSFTNDDKIIENKETPEDSIEIAKGDFQDILTVIMMLRFFQDLGRNHFVEGIGLGMGYGGDTYTGEDPGVGFATKVELGYLFDITEQIQLGIVLNVTGNHRMSREYMNLSAGAQVQTVYHF